MNKYIVNAARSTGEWLDLPLYDGEVNIDEWCAMSDTDDVHYDTYDYFNADAISLEDSVNSETRAIEVHWVD